MMTDRILVDAIAEWMADNGLANLTWNNTNGLPNIAFGAMPATPDNAVTINVYNSSIARDDRGNPDYYVQFRFRAAGNDPGPVGDMADALAELLLDATHLPLTPAVVVRHATRTVRTPVGLDDSNKRYERADSYRLNLKPLNN